MWARAGMRGGSTQAGAVERLPWEQAGPAGVSGLCPGALRFTRQPEPPCPSPCSAVGAGWDQGVPFHQKVGGLFGSRVSGWQHGQAAEVQLLSAWGMSAPQ